MEVLENKMPTTSTATIIFLENIIDYSSQLNSIVTELGNLNTKLNTLNFYLSSLAGDSPYFSTFPRVEEASATGSWTGMTTTIALITQISPSYIKTSYRVEGNNIDYDTFVTSVTTASISGTTVVNSIEISKSTLGSPAFRPHLYFYAT